MRDIKFRAYIRDKNPRVPSEINKIVEVKSLHLGSKKAIIGYSGGNYSIKFDEIELMQYTGLKDKKGKEIYEGDIVKSFFVDTDEAGNEIYKYYIIEVKYDEVLCSYKIDKFMNLEVIGNIYDNPELLEKGE